MKKDELIEILIIDGEFTKKQLKKMKLDEVQLLFDERFDIEFEDDDISKIQLAENKVSEEHIITEDGYINGQTEAERLGEYIEEPEIVEIDITKLSPVEQRQYRRTGILPQVTINRYTRFDDETPKMDN